MKTLQRIAVLNVLLLISCMAVKGQSDAEIEGVLEKIFSPAESSMHTQALRRDIVRRLYDALQREEMEDLLDYKRSINSLARWNNLPGKRNLAALARGGYIKTIPDDENDKRSIAALAKNGQLPTFQSEEEKRGIEALARNGELHRKREIQELIDELYDKRNIGSLARSYSFPSYGKRYLGALARSGGYSRFADKRNVASIARDGFKYAGKRNVAALLRQDRLHDPNDRSYDDLVGRMENESFEDKRNIGSIKASSGFKTYKRSAPDAEQNKQRTKREVDYYEMNDEYASPVYQNQNIYDYEELMKALTGEYPNTDKRFLGSVARSGWFRSPSASSSRYVSRIDKRHIGSLARLGWLPSFRSVRRFSRSGRSVDQCDREAAADGEAEDYAFAEDQLPVGGGESIFLRPSPNARLMNGYMEWKQG